MTVHNNCKDWKRVFEAKLSVFGGKNTVAYRDIFSHCASILRSWRFVFPDLCIIRYGEPQRITVGGKLHMR